MQRAPEITYYEELGVTRTASHEQIRDAFRALVRLLHPDQQTDEHLRNIAEVQMRKLNRIYAVLSDAEKRRNYDDTLDQSPSARTIILRQNAGPTVQRLLAHFAWIGAVLIVVALLAWLSSEGPGSTVQSIDRPGPLRPPAITASADTQSEVAQLRRDLNQARAERDAAVRELAHLRTSPGRKPESDPQDTEVTMPTPALPTPVSSEIPVPTHAGTSSIAAPALRSTAAPQKTFAGFWFYTRPVQGQHNKNTSLYPPEFIEATVTEQNGVVRGRYRSRYLIVDRAISPDVNFEFSGTPNGATVSCPWSGPGGSRGELTLRMTTDHTLEIEWTASELGSIQGLVSGTAHLTRRVEP